MSARALFAGLVLALLCISGVQAQPAPRSINIDLARQRVSITSGFSGAEVLLYGAVDQRSDIVAYVTSTRPEPQTVIHKQRVFGIWVNRGSATFTSVPVLHTVVSTRPLLDIASSQVWRNNRIDFSGLDIQPVDPSLAEFRAGLIAAKMRQGLYNIDEKGVVYVDGRLFRATLHFPAALPPGNYTVTVLQLREGRIIDAAVRPLTVHKVGVGAWISDLALNNGLIYGLLAIFVAATAGLLAGYAFRR
ncbi:MAG: TIGR02186 family protein [Rhodospirillales bacterium]